MKLKYRGVNDEYQPIVLETKQGEVDRKYLSSDWRFRNLKKAPVILPVENLTYRGVKYSKPGTVGTGGTTIAEPAKAPTHSVEAKARALMYSHTRMIKKRQVSMLARATAAIGSPAKAADYWNRIQGKVHPTFRASYDRLGATMS